MTITLEVVRQLREKTGAGVANCKEALEESGGDLNKAIDVLRKKGIDTARKKIGRVTKEGCIESYIHPGNKIGVMIEINCETDFVARNEDFRKFVKDLEKKWIKPPSRFQTRGREQTHCATCLLSRATARALRTLAVPGVPRRFWEAPMPLEEGPGTCCPAPRACVVQLRRPGHGSSFWMGV